MHSLQAMRNIPFYGNPNFFPSPPRHYVLPEYVNPQSMNTLEEVYETSDVSVSRINDRRSEVYTDVVATIDDSSSDYDISSDHICNEDCFGIED